MCVKILFFKHEHQRNKYSEMNTNAIIAELSRTAHCIRMLNMKKDFKLTCFLIRDPFILLHISTVCLPSMGDVEPAAENFDRAL